MAVTPRLSDTPHLHPHPVLTATPHFYHPHPALPGTPLLGKERGRG